MPSVEDRSMTLLLPAGSEFSTVPETTRDSFVASNFAVVADKERICKWLFNAKTIRINIVDTNSASPSSLTYDINACDPGFGVVASSRISPHNDIFVDTGEIACPLLRATGGHDRWKRGSGDPHNYFFYVFVFEGEWYWSPGVIYSLQTVSPLGDSSFSISFPSGDGTYTLTASIIETFYP